MGFRSLVQAYWWRRSHGLDQERRGAADHQVISQGGQYRSLFDRSGRVEYTGLPPPAAAGRQLHGHYLLVPMPQSGSGERA